MEKTSYKFELGEMLRLNIQQEGEILYDETKAKFLNCFIF